MTALVLLDHDNIVITSPARSAVAAEAASQLPGVTKVLVVDD